MPPYSLPYTLRFKRSIVLGTAIMLALPVPMGIYALTQTSSHYLVANLGVIALVSGGWLGLIGATVWSFWVSQVTLTNDQIKCLWSIRRRPFPYPALTRVSLDWRKARSRYGTTLIMYLRLETGNRSQGPRIYLNFFPLRDQRIFADVIISHAPQAELDPAVERLRDGQLP